MTPGALVQLGPHRGPVFRVEAVVGERAWVAPLANGDEGFAPLHRLRVVNSPTP